jgi:hypothetical protein
LVKDGDRFETSFEKRPGAAILLIRKSSEWFFQALHEPTERRQTTSSLSHPIGVVQFRLDHFLRRLHRFAICTARRIEAKPTLNDFLIGPIFGFFAIDTQEQVKVIVHGAKATDGDRKDLVQFFESLVDPIFPLETVLIGKQMGFPAASGKAVIPTTYGRIYQSAASFSHRKSPLRNIRFSPQNLPNCKTNAICCACPFLFFLHVLF